MRPVIVFLLVLATLAPSLSWAQSPDSERDQVIANSQTFINQHPDLLYRQRGLKAYKKGRHSEALFHFKMAAKFADKPSQGMVAERLWKGEGAAVDRQQAYAWIDLAAERGYPSMVISREKMWSMLSESERKKAGVLGQPIYEVYGDSVAKPRMEAALVQAKRNSVTGSRLGFATTVVIEKNDPKIVDHGAASHGIEGEVFYQDKLWEPAEYWKWQDTAWKKPNTGNVEVGPLETKPKAPSK